MFFVKNSPPTLVIKFCLAFSSLTCQWTLNSCNLISREIKFFFVARVWVCVCKPQSKPCANHFWFFTGNLTGLFLLFRGKDNTRCNDKWFIFIYFKEIYYVFFPITHLFLNLPSISYLLFLPCFPPCGFHRA